MEQAIAAKDARVQELLRTVILKRAQNSWDKQKTRYQSLSAKGLDQLTGIELAEYQRLDETLMSFPSDARYLMPTRLGRLLRAAELVPWEHYRLDGAICWPRLWLLLPEQTREELGRIRKELDTAVELWIWGLLTVVWMPWAVWVAGIAITLMFYVYRWSLRTSQVYASLIVAAYDLHRIGLYRALRWPLPQNPAEERIQGEALTQYLWRGSDRKKPMFQLPTNDR